MSCKAERAFLKGCFKMNKDSFDKYAKFLDDHIKDIAKLVDAEIDEHLIDMRSYVISFVKDKFKHGRIDHYVWSENYLCPYDTSGVINKDGWISDLQTIDCFLENEYTGNCIATYCSGHGFDYETYGKALLDEIEHIVYLHICNVIRRYLDEAFNMTIPDEDFEDLRIDCDCFSEVDCFTKAIDWYTECDDLLKKISLSCVWVRTIIDSM
jgi:hypothetical protein